MAKGRLEINVRNLYNGRMGSGARVTVDFTREDGKAHRVVEEFWGKTSNEIGYTRVITLHQMLDLQGWHVELLADAPHLKVDVTYSEE